MRAGKRPLKVSLKFRIVKTVFLRQFGNGRVRTEAGVRVDHEELIYGGDS